MCLCVCACLLLPAPPPTSLPRFHSFRPFFPPPLASRARFSTSRHVSGASSTASLGEEGGGGGAVPTPIPTPLTTPPPIGPRLYSHSLPPSLSAMSYSLDLSTDLPPPIARAPRPGAHTHIQTLSHTYTHATGLGRAHQVDGPYA